MIVVIDMQSNQSMVSRNQGIGRYSNSLVKEIIRNYGSHQIFIVLNGALQESIKEIRDEFEGLLSIDNIKIWHTIEPVSFYPEENNWRRKVAELSREAFIASLAPDLVIVPSLFEGLDDNVVTSIDVSGNKIPTAMILYDLIPLVYKDIFTYRPNGEEWYEDKLESLRRADLLLAISESTKQDAIRYLGISPQKVYNISGAVCSYIQPVKVDIAAKARFLNRYRINRPFVMYTGEIEYLNNVEGLIRGYALLPESLLKRHQLVLVCSIQPERRKELQELTLKHGLNSDDVILANSVSDEDLFLFYNLCKLFVSPSFYEGFGFHVLEAMSCGRAVVASNCSSMPEVIGREDVLFDPYNDQSIADKLFSVLTDDVFRHSLEDHGLKQAKTFSWDKSAKRTITAIESLNLLGEKEIVTLPNNLILPKLAFLSPLPPERSGISDYSAELLPELAKYYIIEVIVDQPEISDPWINSNCAIRNYEWFKTNSNTYDRVLYHFGNSQFHKNMFSSLEIIPGVVVLHDFYLSHIVACLKDLRNDYNSFEQFLYQSHGYSPLKKIADIKDRTELVWSYPCNLNVLQNSLGVIVHSTYSCDLARKWYGEKAANDWTVIPLLRVPAALIDPIEARIKLRLNASDFVVCSFGRLGTSKLNERLLHSWLDSSLSKDENCKLIFVGENPEGHYRNEIETIINESGLSHRIMITGWTDSETFRNYLSAADLGVQLRTLSRGETSAAILDCLNFGLPTIANANGSIAEFSEEVLFKISDNFENSELTEALETLWNDEKRRKEISRRAQEYIHEFHYPKKCARQYVQAIESFYQHSTKTKTGLIKSIGKLNEKPENDEEIFSLASTLAQNFPPCPLQKQLLVDITEFGLSNNLSDFQQVLPSILLDVIEDQPGGYRVEPVYYWENQFYYARQFTVSFLNVSGTLLNDEPVEYHSGDILLVLDWRELKLKDSFLQLAHIKSVGVDIYFFVTGILPLRLRQHFTKDYQIEFEKFVCRIGDVSKGVICTSKTTADDLIRWFEIYKYDKKISMNVSLVQLGGILSTSELHNLPKTENDEFLNKIKKSPCFLLVGTIGSHTGHLQTLAAFDELWSHGVSANLVIIGDVREKSITTDNEINSKIISAIRNHYELNQRLFWINEIKNDYLCEVYSICNCIIAPAEGEGIGLSIYDALEFGKPIIARNIPIFHEIAGEFASYFEGVNETDLSAVIKEWIGLNGNNNFSNFDNALCQKTGKYSKQLMKIFSGNSSYYEIKTENVKRIFIDVSIVVLDDLKTGIQRVVRSVVLELLKNPPEGYVIVPISIQQDYQNSSRWYIVERYFNNKIGEYNHAEVISPLEPTSGDVFLGLDFSVGIIINSERDARLFSKWRRRGVNVVFVIYDLLPLCMPDKFPPDTLFWHTEWFKSVLQVSDKLICISKSTLIDVQGIANGLMDYVFRDIDVDYFHLGADIQNSLPTKGVPDDYLIKINKIKSTLSFLMVGTIEPRKGHKQALIAFEELWEQGVNVNLVFVGKQGWMVDELMDEIKNHYQLNRRLFLLQSISDEYLEIVYSACACLLNPSEGEGFGLPLIEAAQHEISIIARDIPVFREIAGDHAYYFSGLSASDLSSAIKDWIQLYHDGKAPKSVNMPFLTWAQSAEQLKNAIFKKSKSRITDTKFVI